MKIRAPAKVNLWLRVLDRRDDGYHLIDSLIVPVSLYDEIEIVRMKGKGRRLTVTSDSPDVPSGGGNLAYRAASLLLASRGIRDRLRIRIRKGIPVGAGLGGGSSDAAATLMGLNRLFRLNLPRREIVSLASRLGADVPFFVYGRPARASGIGERIKPLRSFPRLWMVILYPRFGVSTRWVYQNVKLTKPGKPTSINILLRDSKKVLHLLANDLEKVTIRRYPRVGLLKKRLIEEGAAGALMAGSGSSIVGIFTSEQHAKKAWRRLGKEKGIEAYLAHSLS
ncbi:MAG: 4-(cytidine 5'-diphospho)-2-C-methyl-D-erythritol kinase [Candidatus Binatia bacterium]